MKKLLLVLLVLAMATPAIAADWNFYGQGRVRTFWVNQDKGDLSKTAGVEDDSDLIHNLQANARVGAAVKTSDQIGGRFEFGAPYPAVTTGGDQITAGVEVYVRRLFGTYTTAGGGQWLVGQEYTPLAFVLPSNSVFANDGNLLGIGVFHSNRKPMIQYQTGGLKFAFVDPTPGVKSLGAFNDLDTTIPKLELSWRMKTDAWLLDLFGGYLQYALEDNTAKKDEDITTYALGFRADWNFGAGALKFGASYGQNIGAYGQQPVPGSRTADGLVTAGLNTNNLDNPALVNGKVEDTTTMQAFLLANFASSDKIKWELGIGYKSDENEKWYKQEFGKDNAYVQIQYYLNMTYTIAPGFFIVPEIGAIDFGKAPDDNTELGTDTYIGLKTQINF